MPYADPEKGRAKDRERYYRNRDEELAKRREYYKKNRARIRAERSRKRTPEARKRDTAAMKRRHAALRVEMIAAYGGICKCCGEKQPLFLELDHIANDGHVDRRVIGRGSGATYRALKKQGWPQDRYQLLCANCNSGKARNGGVCPHGL